MSTFVDKKTQETPTGKEACWNQQSKQSISNDGGDSAHYAISDTRPLWIEL